MPPGRYGEVGKRDLAIVAFPIVGDEEKIFLRPHGAIGWVGRGTLLEGHLSQDSAQCHHGQLFRLELYEEDAPWLLG